MYNESIIQKYKYSGIFEYKESDYYSGHKLISFRSMPYNNALSYYIRLSNAEKRKKEEYYDLYIDIMGKSLRAENFSDSQVEIFLEAIKKGYDYNWLIVPKAHNKGVTYYKDEDKLKRMLEILLCNESLKGDCVSDYPNSFVNAIQETLFREEYTLDYSSVGRDRGSVLITGANIYADMYNIYYSEDYIGFLDLLINKYKINIAYHKDILGGYVEIRQNQSDYDYDSHVINIPIEKFTPSNINLVMQNSTDRYDIFEEIEDKLVVKPTNAQMELYRFLGSLYRKDEVAPSLSSLDIRLGIYIDNNICEELLEMIPDREEKMLSEELKNELLTYTGNIRVKVLQDCTNLEAFRKKLSSGAFDYEAQLGKEIEEVLKITDIDNNIYEEIIKKIDSNINKVYSEDEELKEHIENVIINLHREKAELGCIEKIVQNSVIK